MAIFGGKEQLTGDKNPEEVTVRDIEEIGSYFLVGVRVSDEFKNKIKLFESEPSYNFYYSIGILKKHQDLLYRGLRCQACGEASKFNFLRCTSCISVFNICLCLSCLDKFGCNICGKKMAWTADEYILGIINGDVK